MAGQKQQNAKRTSSAVPLGLKKKGGQCSTGGKTSRKTTGTPKASMPESGAAQATTAATARTHPKRKRAEVSYHESSSDESGVDDGYDTLDYESTTMTTKKLKSSRTTIISSKPLPKRKIFPFMRLPAELRNEIYGLALTDPGFIFLGSKIKRYRRTVQWLGEEDSLVLNIFLLNRAIYAETQPIFYAGNTFYIKDATTLHTFLAHIGPKNRATITELIVESWDTTTVYKTMKHPALTMLVDAVNLTRLRLGCQTLYSDDPKRVAKQLYRDGFHWLEAAGVAKGRFDAAVDVVEIPDWDLNSYLFPGRERKPTSDELREEFKAELRRLLS